MCRQIFLRVSIYQHKHGGFFGSLHHVGRFHVLGVRLFDFSGYLRHGLKKAKQETALHRVIDVLRQLPARGQRRLRAQFGGYDVIFSVRAR